MVPQLWPFLAAQAALYLAVSLHAIFRDVKRLDDIFSFHGSEPEKRLKRLLVMLTLPWILLVLELALDAALTLKADTKAVLAVVRVACIFAVCVMAVFPSPLVPTPKHPVPATKSSPSPDGEEQCKQTFLDADRNARRYKWSVTRAASKHSVQKRNVSFKCIKVDFVRFPTHISDMGRLP